LESKPVASGKVRYHKIIYTGDMNAYHLKFEQYYFVTGNVAYVLTFTCEQDNFDKFRNTGEQILNSFQMK